MILLRRLAEMALLVPLAIAAILAVFMVQTLRALRKGVRHG